MNRIIRFNAWIPELGFMIEDVSYGHGTIGFPSIDFEGFDEALKAKGFDPKEMNLPSWLYDTGEDWYQIDDPKHFVLLQFIGVEDNNQEETFEDDIIQSLHGINTKFIVSFSEGTYYLSNVKLKYKPAGNETYTLIAYLGFLKQAATYFKVIGNIYQNPELLSNESAKA